ncbi:bifunctional diguanylate cyclase/phosphodiesterase [Roseomonas sp. 18066]|uniref:putative bifunctional diguanylate cyclase/phosphodiesterase n=1 Tax=Roseomonas sp. 18066 TaxID=2681412 RepID=UPI00135CD193|nr:EAL domain-containing protein [Roseomonas sp. 18066]
MNASLPRRLLTSLARLLWKIAGARPSAAEIDALHRSEALHRLIAEHATDMIVRLELDGTRTYVSPAARGLLGYEPEQLVGISTFLFVHPADLGIVRERLRRVTAGEGDQRGRNRVIRADGRTVWVEASLRLVRDPATGAPRELVSVVRDVSAQKANEERIEQLAAADSLTGLPNRRALEARLTRLLAEGGRCALFFIDLDQFKPINDLHGHAVGDAVLVALALRLQRAVPPDAMVARLGGDEFALILPDTPGLADQAEAILRLLSLPIALGDISAELGGSIGIALAPGDGAEAEALIRAADLAMYHAKRDPGGDHRGDHRGEHPRDHHGGFRFFTGEMERALRQRARDQARLRGAIAGGEMLAHYQPVVALGSRRLVALQVQPRWQHPERGLLPPDEFLQQVGEGGLAGELFMQMLRQACQDAAGWPLPLQVALPLPAQQLLDARLPRQLLAILAETGLAPARLELEIGQAARLRDHRIARQVVAALRAAGIGLSLADFGSGGAHLATLKQMRVHRLKIDASFAGDPDGADYAAAIIALARGLGLGTTAEGLEDEAGLQRLLSLGCERGQGPLFGRPGPAAQLGDGLLAGADAGAWPAGVVPFAGQGSAGFGR